MWNETFGNLRSLLEPRELGEQEHQRLRRWVVEAAREFPIQFVEQAKPYLASFEHHWQRWPWPLTVAYSMSQFEAAIEQVPASWVLLDLSHQKKGITTTFAAWECLSKVHHLSLTSCRLKPKQLVKLFGNPQFPHLTSLSLADNPLELDGLNQLAGLGKFSRLRHLNLTACGLTFSEAIDPAAVFGWERERALEHLILDDNWIGEAPRCSEIFASAGFEQLRSLSLNRCDLKASSLRPRVNTFEHLEHLWLGSNALEVEDPEVRKFLKLQPRLKSLSLLANELEPSGLALLVKDEVFDGLESLNLAGNLACRPVSLCLDAGLEGLRSLDLAHISLNQEEAHLLFHESSMTNLQELKLGGCNIGPNSTATLALSPNLGQLQRLRLSSCKLGNQGAKYLSQAPFFENLDTLSLASNRITSKGLDSLITHMKPGQFEYLDLGFNNIGTKGLASLLGSGALSRIRHLDLSGCHIGSAKGAHLLVSSSHLNSLEYLGLRQEGLDENWLDLLADQLPSLSFLDVKGAQYPKPHAYTAGLRDVLGHQGWGRNRSPFLF